MVPDNAGVTELGQFDAIEACVGRRGWGGNHMMVAQIAMQGHSASGWDNDETTFAVDVRNELPAPTNFALVVLKQSITLSWQWPRPEVLPVFKDFGYEVKRSDGKTFRTPNLTYGDENLAPGTYAYQVRVRGRSREKGKAITYVSDWTGPAAGTIVASCPRVPTVELTVEPTQKEYASISSLRFHIHGKVAVEAGCTLGNVRYRLDTGTGVIHNGPLKVDGQGRFDQLVNAIGPEDEIPAGRASFSFTVTAEDEVGPVTSDAYTLDMELRNPFAPH